MTTTLPLPTAASGVLYCGSTRADLTTNKSLTSSSDSMTQLRFVPNGAYTGSVSIPYVALGSSGTAIAAGTEDIPAKVILRDGTVQDLLLHVRGLTGDEKEIILDGCLMNYYAKRIE